MLSQRDVEKLRHDFPMLKQKMNGKPLIYLDSAATMHKPQPVVDAICDYYTQNYSTVHRSVYSLVAETTQKYHSVRKKVQKFINAAKETEIVFTKGTTESINLVASSFGKAFISSGDEIILSVLEHHSNIVPWQIMAEERGAILKIIPVNDKGELLINEYEELLNDKTKLVAITHISNSIGSLNPVKQIIDMAHDVGSKVLLDGAQSVPHTPVDVQSLDVDFFAFSGHKMAGPTGIGVLYGKKGLLDRMPPYQGGGDMIDIVTFEKTSYAALPNKFEAGTPLIAQVMGLGAALDYLNGVGMENIMHYEHSLLQYATEQISQIDRVRIIGQAENKGAIISFVVDGSHPLDVGSFLDLHGVAVRTGHHCAQPVMDRFGITSTVRVSLAFYNTFAEIDSFVVALKSVLKRL